MRSGVILTPVSILVARHELDCLFQVSSLSMREILRMALLDRSESLRGDLMPSSRRALTPGLSSTGSEALVPSATTSHPFSLATSITFSNIAFLQW